MSTRDECLEWASRIKESNPELAALLEQAAYELSGGMDCPWDETYEAGRPVSEEEGE